VYRPAVSTYSLAGESVGTPSIMSTIGHDLYLTLPNVPSTGSATIGVLIEPLVSWVWIGGALILGGTLLAAWPGRRRRPTDPVSAAIVGAGRPAASDAADDSAIGVGAGT
jgi:cytochrome c-type biogenesis protein CcmF